MTTGEQLRRDFEQLPPEKQEEVLDFVAWLTNRYRSNAPERASIMSHAGRLEGSPNLNDDPVRMQQALRDHW